MSVKQIIINSDASTTSAVVSGANRTPTNFPELVFGDSYSIVVKFTGNSEDGFVAPDSSAQYLFNIGALSRATIGTFEISYDGEYTDVLPFNASADMIATALNSLPEIASAGGVNVSGTDGSPYRIIFKQNGGRKNFEIRSNLFPDTNPIVHIVNSGDDNSCCELLIVLKLDTIASVSNYIVNQSTKELRFDVSLNTVECLLALGTSDKVRLLAELKRIDSNGNVFTYSQSQCTIHNRLIDVNTLEYATIELTGVLESVKAVEKKMADLYSPYTIKRKGEFWFTGGISEFAKVSNMSMNGSWSLCCRIRMQTTQVRYASIFHFGAFYLYWNTRLCVLCSPVILTAKQISVDDNNRLANGEWHSLVVSYDGTTLKLTDETGVLLSVATSEAISILGNLLIGEAGYNGQIADVKYFNFDMSDANAPYTIADYISGKDESPLLKLGNDFNFNLTSESTFTQRVQASNLTLTDSSTNIGYIRFEANATSSSAPYFWFPLGKTIKKGAKVKVSFDYKIIENYGFLNAGFGNINSTTIPELFISGTNTITLSNDCDCIVFRGASGTTIQCDIRLSAFVNGASLALEDYTFNGKVFDTSGNNNIATITGAVYGSKDNAIEQMYQAFSSRIGNLTE